MMTFRQFQAGLESIPVSTTWLLADLGEARGKQELYTKQAPQKLKALRDHAIIESAISSNRMEGVEVEQARVRTVVFGKAPLRDRDEEEVRGYRRALQVIHEQGKSLALTQASIKKLHRLTRGGIGDACRYKEKPNDIVEKFPDGRVRVRFHTVAPIKTTPAMRELLSAWSTVQKKAAVHPLIALAAFNLDFLCIHPFRDGNGRVSRLLLLLMAYHLGIEVGRYISLERLIEQSKERNYETLGQSSQGWHEGEHDPWPFVNYALYTLRSAYQEFEKRFGQTNSPRGAKTELVELAVCQLPSLFRITELQRQCPGVSLDMIRHLLKAWQRQGMLECVGRGPQAQWRKTAKKI